MFDRVVASGGCFQAPIFAQYSKYVISLTATSFWQFLMQTYATRHDNTDKTTYCYFRGSGQFVFKSFFLQKINSEIL